MVRRSRGPCHPVRYIGPTRTAVAETKYRTVTPCHKRLVHDCDEAKLSRLARREVETNIAPSWRQMLNAVTPTMLPDYSSQSKAVRQAVRSIDQDIEGPIPTHHPLRLVVQPLSGPQEWLHLLCPGDRRTRVSNLPPNLE